VPSSHHRISGDEDAEERTDISLRAWKFVDK
jgi:hypothetical protein